MRWLGWSVGTGVFLLVLGLGAVRILVDNNAVLLGRTVSPGEHCDISLYRNDYDQFGITGRLVSLFSDPVTYRVHDKNAVLLISTLWRLSPQPIMDMAPEWSSGKAIYPTIDGYRKFNVPECRGLMWAPQYP